MAERNPILPRLNLGDTLYPSLLVTDCENGDRISLLDIAAMNESQFASKTLFVLLRHSN